jgi:hypothetical protein
VEARIGAVSRSTLIFAGPDEPANAVRAVIESVLGGRFTFPAETGEDPYLVHERADVYVGPHDHEDDEITSADGAWIPLGTGYPHRIEVRDLDRDTDRQQALGRQIFDALRADGRWQLVYIDDMQAVLDSYQPAT